MRSSAAPCRAWFSPRDSAQRGGALEEIERRDRDVLGARWRNRGGLGGEEILVLNERRHTAVAATPEKETTHGSSGQMLLRRATIQDVGRALDPGAVPLPGVPVRVGRKPERHDRDAGDRFRLHAGHTEAVPAEGLAAAGHAR